MECIIQDTVTVYAHTNKIDLKKLFHYFFYKMEWAVNVVRNILNTISMRTNHTLVNTAQA